MQNVPFLWLRLLHTAENHGPIMFHTDTVSHKRWDPCLLYRTSLNKIIMDILVKREVAKRSPSQVDSR